jgi:replicative DNA helicase
LPIKLNDPDTLAKAIMRLIVEPDLKRDLIRRGNMVKDRLLNNEKESINIFKNIFNNFSLKKECSNK